MPVPLGRLPSDPASVAPPVAPSVASASTSESPCIKVCQLDLDDRCRGCGRHLDEIRDWRDMTVEQRIAINQRLGFVSHERRR